MRYLLSFALIGVLTISTGVIAQDDSQSQDPSILVRQLRDGTLYGQKNSTIVEQLKELGAESIDPLIEATEDASFKGRGSSAMALANVLVETGEKNDRALVAILNCFEDEDWWVRMSARYALHSVKDERIIGTLARNFTPNVSASMEELTGQSFESRKSAIAWWEEHKEEFPEQLAATVSNEAWDFENAVRKTTANIVATGAYELSSYSHVDLPDAEWIVLPAYNDEPGVTLILTDDERSFWPVIGRLSDRDALLLKRRLDAVIEELGLSTE